jgi:ubiquinone/menaquinone biosynthesis C-methylase UbiE
MNQRAIHQLADSSSSQEVYTHGYSDTHRQFLAVRTAATCASFFVPYLRPDMKLLDCGCGQGSLTLDFANLLTQGTVTGIDLEPDQIEAAQAGAAEAGITNVQFQVANVYTLPFPPASFDAVFANCVLEHLTHPFKALQEMRRVLKPGGILGVQDPDYRTVLLEPTTPLLRKWITLYVKVHKQNGGSPHYAPKQRQWLAQLGCVRTEGYTLAPCWANQEATRWIFTTAWKDLLSETSFSKTVVEHGWATQAELEAMLAEFQRWAERPDGYHALLLCAAVGWVGAA